MNMCLLVFYLTIMINYSILLTVIGIATAVLNYVIMRITAQKQVNLSRMAQVSGGKLSGVTMSGIEMIETIKASGAENGFFERWAGYYARQHNAQIAISKFNQYISAIPSFLSQAANVFILMAGVYLILDGAFSIGMLMAFQGFLSSFLSPVTQLIDVGQSFITMRSSMERVEDVLNYQPDVTGEEQWSVDGIEPAGKLSGQIDIKNITFGYNWPPGYCRDCQYLTYKEFVFYGKIPVTATASG
jgi:ABC-type bacteriocin/lantibiotic exporter with double-glycine peptidase domain